MIRRYVSLLLVIVMLLSACSNITGKKQSNGILAIYSTGWKEYDDGFASTMFSLTWVDPETGNSSVYRVFSPNDENICIDPLYVLSRAHGHEGRAFLHQFFDSTYERILAKNAADNSWGWVDLDGNYTDVTSEFDGGDSKRGIGFYQDYYYFFVTISEPNHSSPLLSSKIEAYRVPIESPNLGDYERVEICDPMFEDTYKGKTYGNEIYHGIDVYLIQEKESETAIYPYLNGNKKYNSPVFYDKAGGFCVSSYNYDDWISPTESIYSDSGTILKASAQELDNQPYWKDGIGIYYAMGTKIIEKSGNQINSYKEYEYYNPVVNTNRNCFVCIENHFVENDKKSWIIENSLCFFTFDGELISRIQAEPVSANNSKFSMTLILDWIE